MIVEKEFIRISNGEKLAYLKAGNGKKTLILIHGNYTSSVQFLPLLNQIDEDFTAYAIDLRGFGDSTYYRRVNFCLDWADDIYRFITKFNLENIFIIGHSLGGGVAMDLVARHPDLVKKLVLISSTTYRGYPLYKKDRDGNIIFAETFSSADELREDEIEVMPILNALENQDRFKVENFLKHTLLRNCSTKNSYYHLMIDEAMKERCLIDADFAIASLNMGSEHNFYNAGNQGINYIKIPVLHLVGNNDLLIPKDMVLDNYYALKNVSTMIEYLNYGHGLLIENPDVVSKDIFNFLKNDLIIKDNIIVK